MSSPNQIADLVTSISDDVRAILADEIALAKAEIKPVARRVGVGSGLFGAAGYFAVSATIMLWMTMAAGFGWLYTNLADLSPWPAAFFGALTAALLLLIVAAVLALVGKHFFSKVETPQKTPQSVSQAVVAVKTGLQSGKERVAAEIKSPSTTPQIEPPASGATQG